MLWRRCPGLMPRGLRGWIAKRFARGCSLQCKGIGGASRPSKGLLAAAADGRRGSGAGGGHHRRAGAERDGVCAWTRADLCRWLEERFAKTYHPIEHDPGSTADGIFPPEGAPEPPAKGRRSAGELQKRGLRDILKATAAAHPDKRLQLWFQDEARVGNKGRVCHGGGAGASVPPGRVKSATSGPTSSPPCARTPATTSPW